MIPIKEDPKCLMLNQKLKEFRVQQIQFLEATKNYGKNLETHS